jgi:hypothetical protein
MMLFVAAALQESADGISGHIASCVSMSAAGES